MSKRILLYSLALILLLSLPFFAQDKSDPAVRAKPAATDDKSAAASSEAAEEALKKAALNPVANLNQRSRAEQHQL